MMPLSFLHPRILAAKFVAMLCCVLAVALPLTESAGARADGPGICIADVNGVIREPLAKGAQHATVLFFITTDCPITNSYAPEMQRIYARFKPRGVHFYAVYVDPAVSASQAKKHAAAYGLTCTAICDVHHDLAKRCGATVMPEAALVLPDGAVAYHGRIDDRFIDFGKSRYHATRHDLIEAIDAVLNHKSPSAAYVKAVGCYIPGL